ncbi:MAG: geranylgeranyl reductase family protein [Promethearchaeota archaeon]
MNSIIIVGAGPAGATCADILAKNGFPVIIIEKEKLPRYKPCGGAIPKEMIKEFNIPSLIIQRYFNSLILHHVEENVTLERKGEGAVLWRSDLDNYLTQRACNNGAILENATEVLNITKEENKFHINTNKGIFKSNWLIAADGANSTVLRSFKWKKFAPDEIALTITHEIELTKDIIDERLGKDSLHIYFGKKLIGIGYGWIFPKKQIVSVGWGCQLNDVRNSSGQFQEFLDLIHDKIKGGKYIRKAAHLVPVKVRPFYREQIIVVGDAAGFVDPLSGKGIIYAALSGLLAAQTLKRTIDKNIVEDFEQLYKKSLNQAFLKVLIAKRNIQQDVYGSNENILRFMKLWQNHRSTEIALTLWNKS